MNDLPQLKSTPGPWFPGHLGRSDHPCNCAQIVSQQYSGAIASVNIDNGLSISEGGNDAPPEEEAIANMYLIAAAPDLYKALLALIEIIGPEGQRVYDLSSADINWIRHATTVLKQFDVHQIVVRSQSDP